MTTATSCTGSCTGTCDTCASTDPCESSCSGACLCINPRIFTAWEADHPDTTKSQEESFIISVTDTEFAPTYFSIPRQYVFPTILTADSVAPLKFSYKPNSALAVDDTLVLTLASFGNIPATSTLICVWDSTVDQSCESSYASSTLTITTKAPVTVTAGTEIDFTITTTNTDDVELEGLNYPSTTGIYALGVAVDYATAAKPDESGTIDFILVPTSPEWTGLSVIGEHTTAGNLNSFVIEVKCATCISASPDEINKLRIYFETVDRHGTRIFLDDLGSGIADGFGIPCDFDPSMEISDGICKLYHGSSHMMKPAYIEVTDFSIQTGGTYSSFIKIYLDKLRNPA